MNYLGMGYGQMPMLPVFIGPVVIILIVWTLLWKGLALWRAAKRGDKIWFLVMLIVNSLGILELIYLFLVTGAKLSDFTNSDDRGPIQPA